LEENGIGDGDGNAAVDDEGDDALSSDDAHSSPDDVFSKVPSLNLMGVVSLFFGVMCLRSLCHLREMKVLDEAVLLTRHPPVPMPAKLSGSFPCILPSPRCIITTRKVAMADELKVASWLLMHHAR
jgi:hypothetical protein